MYVWMNECMNASNTEGGGCREYASVLVLEHPCVSVLHKNHLITPKSCVYHHINTLLAWIFINSFDMRMNRCMSVCACVPALTNALTNVEARFARAESIWAVDDPDITAHHRWGSLRLIPHKHTCAQTNIHTCTINELTVSPEANSVYDLLSTCRHWSTYG